METIKPQVLDWLASLVNIQFNHHFSDRWVKINIWDNVLTISLDFRQPAQKELFDLLPDSYKGVKQIGTNKLVNKTTLYFKISDLFPINYPDIIKSELINKKKHQSGSGGWIDVGDFFYTYDWLVYLSDGTTIKHHNQNKTMDMIKDDCIYNTKIQKREFINFIKNNILKTQ
jgi:hypothetical protein